MRSVLVFFFMLCACPVHAFQVPAFIKEVPSGCYAGMSSPCRSLAEAKKEAVSDILSQVARDIGMEYNRSFMAKIWGNEGQTTRKVSDVISGDAHGFVSDIEQSIIKREWTRDRQGRFMYFLLVRYPPAKVREMRRLSRGAHVVASLDKEGSGLLVRVREVNGVEAVLTSASVEVSQENRFADWISYYVVHVPKGERWSVDTAIKPVSVCQSSASVRVPVDTSKSISGYLLGADIDVTVTLSGHDEVGRDVVVGVD